MSSISLVCEVIDKTDMNYPQKSVKYHWPEGEVDHTLFQLLQRDRLFVRFANSAVNGISDHYCFVYIVLSAIDTYYEW
jgi:hypothetical protein